MDQRRGCLGTIGYVIMLAAVACILTWMAVLVWTVIR